MTISLPTGFTHRPAKFTDVEAVVQCMNKAHMALTGTPEYEVDELLTEWKAPGISIENNTQIVIAPTGAVVAYFEFWDADDPPVRPMLFARIDPAYEGLGIGTRFTNWGIEKAKACITRVTDPDLQVSIRCYTYLSHAPSVTLLQSLGMQQERFYLDMEIDFAQTPIQAPVWPSNVVVKTADFETGARQLYDAFRDGWRDHFGYFEIEDKDADFERWRHALITDAEVDANYCFVVWDGDEIAGLLLTRKHYWGNRNYGYVDTLTVRPAWRGKGIAKALLLHTFATFKTLGQTGAALDVDAGSPTGATKLYEKVGMHVTKTKATYELIVRPGKTIHNQG